jgi:Golgi complex component 7 (COG7)
MFGMQLSRVAEDGAATVAGGDTVVSQDSADADPGSNEEAAAFGFVNEWLGAIADATVGMVMTQWLRVASMSPVGRAQLIVDVEYISNVVQAMGLKQHPMLIHLRQLLLKDPASLPTATDIAPGKFIFQYDFSSYIFILIISIVPVSPLHPSTNAGLDGFAQT